MSKLEKATLTLETTPSTPSDERMRLFESLGDCSAEAGNYKQAIEYYLKMVANDVWWDRKLMFLAHLSSNELFWSPVHPLSVRSSVNFSSFSRQWITEVFPYKGPFNSQKGDNDFFPLNQCYGIIKDLPNVFIDRNYFSGERFGPWATLYVNFAVLMYYFAAAVCWRFKQTYEGLHPNICLSGTNIHRWQAIQKCHHVLQKRNKCQGKWWSTGVYKNKENTENQLKQKGFNFFSDFTFI